MDILDHKILYQLDLNARQSTKTIAKKVESNKDTVNYRIHRLIKDGVISGFTTHIDIAKIGYNNIKTYVRFQDIDEKTESEFFTYLNSLPEVGWVVHASGNWDALFCIWASSTFSFYTVLTKILNRFSKYISKKEVIHNINWFYYNRKWLLPNLPQVYQIKYGGEPSHEKLDLSEMSILKELVKNSREKFSKIANTTNISPQSVLAKTNLLQKKGIITKFGTDLDISKFGLVFCKTLIELHNINEKTLDSIFAFCKHESNIFALTTTVGAWDLELEIEAERVDDVMGIMNRFKKTFPHSIKGYDSIVITKQSKINYIPLSL
jgi:DNA-binding Lrp family transcriptional regulator